eukprot:gene8365-10274_t
MGQARPLLFGPILNLDVQLIERYYQLNLFDNRYNYLEYLEESIKSMTNIDTVMEQKILECIKCIERYSQRDSLYVYYSSANNGNTTIFKYLFNRYSIERGGSISIQQLTNIMDSPLSIILLFFEDPKYQPYQNQLYIADIKLKNSFHNDVRLLELFHHNNMITFSHVSMDNASKLGYLDIVDFLYKNRTEGTKNGLIQAANNGNFEVVKFLCKNNLYDQRSGCLYAGKRLDILVYLLENNLHFRQSHSMHILDYNDSSFNDIVHHVECSKSLSKVHGKKIIHTQCIDKNLLKCGDSKTFTYVYEANGLDFCKEFSEFKEAFQYGRVSILSNYFKYFQESVTSGQIAVKNFTPTLNQV